MKKKSIYTLFIFIILFCTIIIITYNKESIIENFYFTTWKPYSVDKYYQPNGRYFFYSDGYMYPL